MAPSQAGRRAEGQDGVLRALIAPAIAFGFVAALLVTRWLREPILPWGGSWEYAPFVARLVALQHWTFASSLGPTLAFDRMDHEYPPGLHIFTLWMGQWTGQDAERVPPTNLLWLLILAWATADVARSFGWTRRAAGASAAVLLLVPSVSGLACRYYYDLPMMAGLWATVAVFHRALAARGLAAITLSVTAAVLLAGACLLKWTAAPWGAVLLSVSAAAARRPGPWFLTGVVAAALLVVVHGGGFDHSSLDHMGRIMAEAPVERPGWMPGFVPTGVLELFGRVTQTLSEATFHRVLWYPVVLLTSHLGVFASLGMVPMLRGGWRALPARTAAVLVLWTVGLWAFAFMMVKVLDERFIGGALPVLAIVAGAGSTRLVPTAVAVVGLTVATLDLHVGRPTDWNRPWVALAAGPSSPVVRARGVSPATSQDGLGWLRRDEEGVSTRAARRSLWEAVRRSGTRDLRFVPGAALVHAQGDEVWLRYEALADKLLRGTAEVAVAPVDGPPRHGQLLLALPEDRPAGWRLVEEIEAVGLYLPE